MYFNKVNIKKFANFEGATFEEYVIFNNARLEEYIRFYGVTFSKGFCIRYGRIGKSDFINASFLGESDFRDVNFMELANFRQVTFGGYAGFKNSNFNKDADFTQATFQGYANFERVTFNGFANYFSSKFLSGGNFKKAIFKDDTNIEVYLDYYNEVKQPKTIFSTGEYIRRIPIFRDNRILKSLLAPADESQIKYRQKISNLENQINDLLKKLQFKSEKEAGYNNELDEIDKKWKILNSSKKILDISNKISEVGKNKLISSGKLKKRFEGKKCFAAVLAIDIRRSTELMLKAKSPNEFAFFISSLCEKMMDIIKTNYGVVDKFTGDGILSFFPIFYTGPDAIYFALNSAMECNKYLISIIIVVEQRFRLF